MTQRQFIPVSIGIPTFNRANGYLRQALQSAVSQDYEPIEIIVSDNCSSDDTESVVRSFDDKRIRYFRQPQNIPANDNFNFCLQQARGIYFLLLHDDDLIDPTFISACMAEAGGKTDIGIIRTGTRLVDQNGAIIKETANFSAGLSLPEFFEAWLTNKTALYLCSTIFNTQGLKAIGGFYSPNNLFQDVVAEFNLASVYGHADIAHVLASYRRHDTNRGDAVQVMAWCEDSRYLLNLMTCLTPENEHRIRELGLSFFSRKCYGKAGIIKNPIKRWRTYWQIYRFFNYAESPAFALKRYDYGFFKNKLKAFLRRPNFQGQL